MSLSGLPVIVIWGMIISLGSKVRAMLRIILYGFWFTWARHSGTPYSLLSWKVSQLPILIIGPRPWQVRLQELFKEEGCDAKLRLDEDGKPYVTDNSNYIIDLYFKTPIKDGLAAGKEISAFEGVVEHGLFLDMATAVIIAGKTGVEVKAKWGMISRCWKS